MTFDQAKFNAFINQHNIIKQFDEPITLKSGKQSLVYVNWRTVAHDAHLMDELTDFVLAFAASKQLFPDTYFGVAEGATTLGLLTQFKYANQQNCTKGTHVLSMGRAKPKEHGDPTDRFFVGAPRGRVCVLEDVTTTGGSLISCIKQLQSNQYSVCAAIGLTNRNEYRDDKKTVKEAINELNVPYYEMSNTSDLLASD